MKCPLLRTVRSFNEMFPNKDVYLIANFSPYFRPYKVLIPTCPEAPTLISTWIKFSKIFISKNLPPKSQSNLGAESGEFQIGNVTSAFDADELPRPISVA